MELEVQWRSAGHTVEHFSLSDAFPKARTSRAGFAIRQALFARRAANYVRKNANRFDVIDSLIGSLNQSKHQLQFDGLLVARSIGLHQLYEEFEQSSRAQPAGKKGSLPGRILYSALRRRNLIASDRSISNADLINVPNSTEADYLRDELRVAQPVIVQPYGLTQALRDSLRESALPAMHRLSGKVVCFIGMWSARKGARDWPHIIRRVSQRVPGVKFRFLGTMVDDATIARDLPDIDLAIYKNISVYEPDKLPALLSDCAVGAFPSYVEGFGLAVIEQLGAAIPTVAYDVAGPREMLHSLPQLLVPVGDHAKFSDRISALLQEDIAAYAALTRNSLAAVSAFDWNTIAAETIVDYRNALDRISTDVLFVQPFGMASAGGGSRILRALVEEAAPSWLSVCTSPQRPGKFSREIHLPTRPGWGRVEHSRFAGFPQMTTSFFRARFRSRLKDLCQNRRVRSIHAVAHSGLDFAVAHDVARELRIPFFLTVHDDVSYTAQHVAAAPREGAIRRAWREAAACFVISDALGREYARRYGARDFVVVTDGVTVVASEPGRPSSNQLRIYFMGMFHMAYERNLRALLESIELFRKHTRREVTVICRCEHIRPHVLHGSEIVTVLPFADERRVQRDIEGADLLYMPIPFGEEHANFARFSLSTKMVTYLGSGVPILYHGPTGSAAYELLSREDAALLATSLEPTKIEASITTLTPERGTSIAGHALRLARNQFMLAEQRRKFWEAISARLADA